MPSAAAKKKEMEKKKGVSGPAGAGGAATPAACSRREGEEVDACMHPADTGGALLLRGQGPQIHPTCPEMQPPVQRSGALAQHIAA